MDKITVDWQSEYIAGEQLRIVSFISEKVIDLCVELPESGEIYDVYCDLPAKSFSGCFLQDGTMALLQAQFRYFPKRRSMYITLNSDYPASQEVYEAMENSWFPLFHDYWTTNFPEINTRTLYSEIDIDS